MTLGTIYSSSLFPGRAPAGEMLVLNYIGGATNRAVVNMSNEQLVEQARSCIVVAIASADRCAARVLLCIAQKEPKLPFSMIQLAAQRHRA